MLLQLQLDAKGSRRRTLPDDRYALETRYGPDVEVKEAVLRCMWCKNNTPHRYSHVEPAEVPHAVKPDRRIEIVSVIFACVRCAGTRRWGAF